MPTHYTLNADGKLTYHPTGTLRTVTPTYWWHKTAQCWMATCKFYGQPFTIGRFTDINAAIKAGREFEKEHPNRELNRGPRARKQKAG
jgi:hypothetical protein